MSYKGSHKKKHYFEGWYYKCVSLNDDHTISLIPGISKNDKEPHAFIQVIVNNHKKIMTQYVRFNMSDFNYNKQTNQVTIQDNIFGINAFEINIKTDEIQIKGRLVLENHMPIKTNRISPSIMGFFKYFPFMECNHDVVSMSHDLSGEIEVDGINIDFNQGKGYLEKDYGRSFPESYVWLQSNHFKHTKTAFMLSFATIPYLGFKFKGFIVNLNYLQKEYRFATYNFSKIKLLDKTEHRISFIVKKGRYQLIIIAENKDTIPLKSPRKGAMEQYIKEGLSGKIFLKLFDKNKLILEDEGFSAGIEIMI